MNLILILIVALALSHLSYAFSNENGAAAKSVCFPQPGGSPLANNNNNQKRQKSRSRLATNDKNCHLLCLSLPLARLITGIFLHGDRKHYDECLCLDGLVTRHQPLRSDYIRWDHLETTQLSPTQECTVHCKANEYRRQLGITQGAYHCYDDRPRCVCFDDNQLPKHCIVHGPSAVSDEDIAELLGWHVINGAWRDYSSADKDNVEEKTCRERICARAAAIGFYSHWHRDCTCYEPDCLTKVMIAYKPATFRLETDGGPKRWKDVRVNNHNCSLLCLTKPGRRSGAINKKDGGTSCSCVKPGMAREQHQWDEIGGNAPAFTPTQVCTVVCQRLKFDGIDYGVFYDQLTTTRGGERRRVCLCYRKDAKQAPGPDTTVVRVSDDRETATRMTLAAEVECRSHCARKPCPWPPCGSRHQYYVGAAHPSPKQGLITCICFKLGDENLEAPYVDVDGLADQLQYKMALEDRPAKITDAARTPHDYLY